MGTLLFYRALMYAQTAMSADDLALAVADMKAAQSYFTTVYPPEIRFFCR